MTRLHDDQQTLLIISPSFLHRMRNVSDKSCRESQNIHFKFNNFFFNCVVYEIMWKNTVEPGRPQMKYGAHTHAHTHAHARAHACTHARTLSLSLSAGWIPTSINTHSEYVILIAFPLQQWLHTCASILCSTYIACLV